MADGDDKDDLDIVFNPNEPRGDLGLTMEEAEDYIAKLEAENKRLEAENLCVIKKGASDDTALIQVPGYQIADLLEQKKRLVKERDQYKDSAKGWERSWEELDFKNDRKNLAIGVLIVVLFVSVFAFLIIVKDVDQINGHQATIDKLTKELEIARAGTTQTEAVVTKTEEPTPQAFAEPLTSIYVRTATLLNAEPFSEHWPLIIQLDDGRKLRVFVSPHIYYRAMGCARFIHTPFYGFYIKDYCLIDPTWHDPDDEFEAEPLFKFSLDDYGPKRKPKRAEY